MGTAIVIILMAVSGAFAFGYHCRKLFEPVPACLDKEQVTKIMELERAWDVTLVAFLGREPGDSPSGLLG